MNLAQQMIAERYSQRSSEIRDAVASAVGVLARTADPDDMNSWFAANSGKLLEIVRLGWQASIVSSQQFLTEYGATLGLELLVPEIAFNSEAVFTSAWVTGPVAFWTTLGRTKNRAAALQSMTSQLAASSARHAMDGGRQAVSESKTENATIRGWRRKAQAGACDFCQDQAARDVLFTKNFRCHDSCACVGIPIFTRDAEGMENGR